MSNEAGADLTYLSLLFHKDMLLWILIKHQLIYMDKLLLHFKTGTGTHLLEYKVHATSVFWYDFPIFVGCSVHSIAKPYNKITRHHQCKGIPKLGHSQFSRHNISRHLAQRY